VPPSNTRISSPEPVPIPDSRITSRISLAVATVGGLGYAPFAPGTFGSAAGLLVWWMLGPSAIVQAGAIVVIFAAGVWSGSVCERHFCRTDPGHVVVDEVAGMLITLLLNPVGWGGAFGGFLLFRLADVIKPFPANRFEQLHGGLGVMADDAMAAVYANLALRLCIWLSGHLVIWSLIVEWPNPITR
jgi:phosphatidylglycerophosphatase A